MKKNISTSKILTIGSLYQLALVSFFIVTLPLVFSIIYTVVEVTNYTEKSQSTLFKTVNTTESNRIILERLTSMERSIRQYHILNESELYDSYLEHRKKLLTALESLKKREPSKSLLEKLEQLQQNEDILHQKIALISNHKKNRLTVLDLNVFDQLTTQARSLIAEGENRLAIEATALSIIANRVRERLVYSAFVSIPLALFLAFIFVHLLTYPIKDIGQAIRNLGEIGLEQPISIKGPKDLTKLGLHLEWLRQRLNRLEYEKQQFIRNVSHELKTPLATLKEGTDLLAENVVGELNTEQQEIIQLMKIGNITINDLIENLLEYQRTISTQVEINLSVFELGVLINHVVNDYQLPLKRKNITLNRNLNTVNIKADHDKLRIIISNLFSNALKFSPQNSVIGLTLYTYKNSIQLIIEDQGPGIAKDIQPFIFEDFYQGNTPKGWKIKASGLGLALVRHYLDAHKGTIKLLPANKEYCGARFSLQIPQIKEGI
jgi:two-component system sensor histidine kinase GlrK